MFEIRSNEISFDLWLLAYMSYMVEIVGKSTIIFVFDVSIFM